jgi:hypothetical protein
MEMLKRDVAVILQDCLYPDLFLQKADLLEPSLRFIALPIWIHL